MCRGCPGCPPILLFFPPLGLGLGFVTSSEEGGLLEFDEFFNKLAICIFCSERVCCKDRISALIEVRVLTTASRPASYIPDAFMGSISNPESWGALWLKSPLKSNFTEMFTSIVDVN